MEIVKPNPTKVYFIAMAAFWFVFGIITAFYPALMNLFQTETGVNAVTVYSDHIWRHDGFDIIAISVLLFALSRENVSRGHGKGGNNCCSARDNSNIFVNSDHSLLEYVIPCSWPELFRICCMGLYACCKNKVIKFKKNNRPLTGKFIS